MSAPWVVGYDSTSVHGKPPMSLECLRCGATVVLRLPVSVNVWVATAKAFEREHARCPAIAEATP